MWFNNGYISFQYPDEFKAVRGNADFLEFELVDPKTAMVIRISISPILVGLNDIRVGAEENLPKQGREIFNSDFIAINEDIYYMLVSSLPFKDRMGKSNEFMYIKDNNCYSFEFVYPYEDAELDDFYLNIIRSFKILKNKYIVEDNEYRINE